MLSAVSHMLKERGHSPCCPFGSCGACSAHVEEQSKYGNKFHSCEENDFSSRDTQSIDQAIKKKGDEAVRGGNKPKQQTTRRHELKLCSQQNKTCLQNPQETEAQMRISAV